MSSLEGRGIGWSYSQNSHNMHHRVKLRVVALGTKPRLHSIRKISKIIRISRSQNFVFLLLQTKLIFCSLPIRASSGDPFSREIQFSGPKSFLWTWAILWIRTRAVIGKLSTQDPGIQGMDDLEKRDILSLSRGVNGGHCV
jgi:hypothetical protein